MLKKIQYTSDIERSNIITENASLILIEEQNIKEGNFLIFSDTLLEPSTVYINVPQTEFEQLRTDVDQLIVSSLEV